LRKETSVEIIHPVDANGVYVRLRPDEIKATLDQFPYYVFDKDRGVVRLMATWDTTRDFIDEFLDVIIAVS
jgi:threonine aldolase